MSNDNTVATVRPVDVFIGAELVAEFPQHIVLSTTPERQMNDAKRWLKEFMEFLSDHRSISVPDLRVRSVTEVQCSGCGHEWDEDDGHCSWCGSRIGQEAEGSPRATECEGGVGNVETE